LQLADLESRDLAAEIDPAVSKPELVIVGRDALSKALADFGRLLHFAVTIVDPLLKISDVGHADRILHILDFSVLPKSNDRFVVVASRGQFDEEAVEQALGSNAAYVGLLANKRRAQEILRSLELKGMPQEKLAKVRFPAGIDIGAESPEEIALSIMAEIVAERRRRHSNKQ
jgi:xanthine dehydrogenase accessory factor